MRIAIHTLGTRGDVQPYLALGRGLRRRGYDVLLVAPAQFVKAVEAEGLGFSPLPAAFLELLETPEAKRAIAKSGAGLGAGFKLLGRSRRLVRSLLEAEWQAAREFGPDAILYHPKALGARHIAARLGVPAILASPLPGFTPTAAFPSPLLPFRTLGPFNRASHALAIHGGSVLFARILREWRVQALGLAATGRLPALCATIYGYSPLVLPKPPDWGPDVAATGYWFLDSPEWEPEPDLAAFLAAGDPPVYVGFGSMPAADPERLTTVLAEGVRRAGRRGVLAVGGGALSGVQTADDMLVIAGAPHDRLFPLVHAIVHHGGAGTTGAALRAGKPSVICPFFGDQPFWARRVAAIGAGPAHLEKRGMTADEVAAALRAADDPVIRNRVATLADAIQSENGVDAATAFVEARLARSAHPRSQV